MKARHKDTGEIIELAEEGIISCDGRRFCWYQVELIPEPIDDFKPSIPSDLDEAADAYTNKEFPDEASCGQWGTGDYEPPVDMEYPREIAKDAFKSGAEWMAQQGQTFESVVRKDSDDELYVEADVDENKFKMADNVTIQVRKK